MDPSTFRIIVVINPLLIASPIFAQVSQYYIKAEWQAAAGPYTTIDFTGYPANTIITNQYQSFGVLFTDGTDRIVLSPTFVNDGAGLYGAIDTISISFSQPMASMATEFPDTVQFHLYSNGQLIFTSIAFGGGGTGFFGGLVSTVPFDAALIFDPGGNVNIDDLHFGPPIPAPGALALLAANALAAYRRRRRNDV